MIITKLLIMMIKMCDRPSINTCTFTYMIIDIAIITIITVIINITIITIITVIIIITSASTSF